MQGTALRYYSRMIAGEYARLCYGNDAGFGNNTRAWRELRRLRHESPAGSNDADVNAAARLLNDEGWLKIDSTAGDSILRRIRSRYEALIADADASIDLGFGRRVDAVRHIIDPMAQIPELGAVFDERVAEVVRTAYGTHFAVAAVRVWRTIHIPDRELVRRGRFRRARPVSVMANLFHNDEHPVSTLKYFVQLTPDVGPDTGALRVIPIHSTRRIVRAGYLRPDAVFGPARRLLAANDDVVVFDGAPGSGLLCNSERCLHRAGIPKAGFERAMIQFTLVPSARPLPADWAAHLPPDPGVPRRALDIDLTRSDRVAPTPRSDLFA
ncbi:MAG: Uncharacterized protein JWM72_2701 [Actinomycetia bacterium]|nr:Uncharacterized protein [Actinomycetes bacterium]